MFLVRAMVARSGSESSDMETPGSSTCVRSQASCFGSSESSEVGIFPRPSPGRLSVSHENRTSYEEGTSVGVWMPTKGVVLIL